MRERGGFFGLTVRRPVALLVLFATLVVVGAIAYVRLPIQLLPQGFQEPSLFLWVPNPGSSPRENEEKVARPIEEQLRTLAGVERIRSWSGEDVVRISIGFDATLDMDLAKAEVRDRLERARPALPETVDRIGMWSEDADQMPVAFFGVLHPGDSPRTDFMLNEIVIPRLESITGVAQVEVWGDLADSVRILLDEDRVTAAGIDIGGLIARLSEDNFAEPLGEIDDGGRRFLLRTDMRFGSLAEIEAYPISRSLTIGDVGEVRAVKSVRDQLSRIDGDYSYFGVAQKDSVGNVVEASRELRAAFEELEADPRLNGELSFLPFFLQGDLIESSLAQLEATALWGGALALVVLFVFLRRLRLTLCVALAIPVSALLALAWEYFAGGSFNLLTMVGITLAIGMLVDNAVVVVENIARRREEEPDGLEAARTGAAEIALAVTLATLTTVVVFLPLIFMSEDPIARVIFGGIGLPLCTSLLFSLLVAVVFLPVVAARILGPRPPAYERFAGLFAPLGRSAGRSLSLLVGLARFVRLVAARVAWPVERVLLAVLAPRHRWLALLGHAGRAVLAALLVRKGLELQAVLDERNAFAARNDLAPGADGAPPLAVIGAAVAAVALLALPPLLARRRRARPARPERLVPPTSGVLDLVITGNRRLVEWTLDHRAAAVLLGVLAFSSIAVPFSQLGSEAFTQEADTDSVRYRVRFQSDYTLSEASDEVAIHEAFLDEVKPEIGFEHWSTRFDDRGASITMYWDRPLTPREVERWQAFVRERAPRPVGHDLRFYDEDNASERSKDLVFFELRGPDSRVLDRLAEDGAALLERVPGLTGVSAPTADAPRQLEVDIDRDLALDLGVNSEIAMNSIGWALRGWPLPRYQEDGRDVPFQIEFDQEATADLSTLRDLRIFTGENVVPLAAFSQLAFRPGSRTIYRRDGQTTATITAQVEDPSRLTETETAGYLELARLDLPRGYSLGRDLGAAARAGEEAAAMLRALLLSLVLLFLLMGILLESVALPFSVLVSVPFSMLGAIWTLWIVGTPMGLIGWIGLIILAGVVVNNGIVLIDRIHRLRAEIGDRRRAIVDGASQRVRPILMTALTTICGLLPMAISEPATNAIDYRSLATVVAGGLAASTFFTLWLVPLAYALIDDLAAAVSREFGWRLGRLRRRAGPTEPPGAELSGSL